MKLWKKVYFVTLIVTLCLVNLGIYGLFHITYKQMLLSEKKLCTTEFLLLQQNLSENVAVLEENIIFTSKYFHTFLSSYNDYYKDNHISLTGWYAEKVSYGKKNSWSKEHTSSLQQVVTISTYNNRTIISVSDCLDYSHPSYRIGLQKDLTDFDTTWNLLSSFYIVGSLILSVGISFILGIVVRRLLKPVDTLIDAVNIIGSGNLSHRVILSGKDELSVLGTQINNMAETLEENVSTLEDEATKKQQLIDNLAHEMNTPLTSIQGFTQYLQLGNIKEQEQTECLQFISQETNRLKNISSTILTMAKLQNNTIPMQEFSLKNLCDRISSIEQHLCQKKQIILTIDCQVNNFTGNEILLESLLRNLIENAFHAITEEGTILVSLKNTSSSLLLSVSDTGCGIPSDKIDCIFEPFYRLDKSRNRAHGGSGLGLPFCKAIVELHNGTITVESIEKEGTIFTILLPDNLSKNFTLL